jgi:hypothetical protein
MLQATARRNMLDTSVSGRDLPLLRKALEIPGAQAPARGGVARPSQTASGSDSGEGFSLSNKVAESILSGLCSVCKLLSRPASNFFWND